MRLIKSVVTLVLISLFSFSGSALAMDATAPEQAPQFFFEAMQRMDYVTAWNLLTPASQSEFLALIKKTEANTELTDEVLRKMFAQGERALTRGFWTQMRQSMGIQIWQKQSFQVFEVDEQQANAFVRVMPADILVFAQSENNRWKFGFVESFVERRKPPEKNTDSVKAKAKQGNKK